MYPTSYVRRKSKFWTRVLEQLDPKPPCVIENANFTEICNSKRKSMRVVLKHRSSLPAEYSDWRKAAERPSCTPAAPRRNGPGEGRASSLRVGRPDNTLPHSNLRQERRKVTKEPFSKKRTTAFRALLPESAVLRKKDSSCCCSRVYTPIARAHGY